MTNPAPDAAAESVLPDFDAVLREVLNEPPAPASPPADPGPGPGPDCILVFPLDRVLAVAEHAMAARSHALAPGDTTLRPRLWWIKGEGTFLMSNGITFTRNTRDQQGHWRHLVYADGWGPDTDPSPVLGPDDHHETLDLTLAPNNAPPLIGQLRAAAHNGATRVHLHVTHSPDTVELALTTQ